MTRRAIITHTIDSESRSQIIDVTGIIETAVRDSGIRQGIAIVFIPHTTAGITINENADPDVKHDLLMKLAKLIPQRQEYYQHAENNSDSHLKTALAGNSATILVEDGRLVLGTWQGVWFCEFDGPRRRQMLIKLIEG